MPRVVLTAEASLGNIAYFEGDLDEAARRYTATLAATDDPAYRRVILQNLASVLFERGDYEQARALQDEGLLLAREAGDRKATGDLLVGLANTADQLGDQDRGGRLRSEAIAQFVAIGDRAGEAAARMSEAGVLRQNGDLLGSVATLERALLLMREIGDELACVEILELLGRPLGQLGRSALAARFVGAADAIRSHRRLARLPQAERSHQETLAELAAAMPTTAQAAAMAVGAQLSLQAALDEALTVCQEIRSS